MFVVPDESVIKLHTAADGNVWYSRGIGAAKNSGLNAAGFLLSPAANGVGLAFRLLGIAQNAHLICALYSRRYKGEVRTVELAGPNILDSREELQDAELVLSRMRQATLSPACGGWHPLTISEYPTYGMMTRMLANKDMLDESAQSYFHMHPAYVALSLIPTLSVPAAAQTLINIVDPRWYIDRRRPDRIKKLELYLGLTPAVQDKVSSNSPLTKAREFRCRAVLQSWQRVSPADADTKDPANFLCRIWHAAGGAARGDLRASQAFLRYLNDNWLVGLETRKGRKDGLFAPNLFFKTPAEVKTYQQHMAESKK
jgi:hypothetical protein